MALPMWLHGVWVEKKHNIDDFIYFHYYGLI